MISATETSSPELKKADFVSDQDVRWCPGCGDYSILNQVQKLFPTLGVPRENFVVISGIGCSSRFPYYMDTYGFHTIHGRAPAMATGVKCANRDLSVWVITGDGDGLSIGGNHLIHAIRRNLDINILLINNRIYGLTKGQYSPTSEQGKVTKSSPFGSIEHPINPLCIAIAAEATFVARAVDTDGKHMQSVLKAAAEHKGCSFVEIYQNCIIFNDGAFGYVKERETKEDRILFLEDGKPLTFGKENEKGIILDGSNPKVVDVNAVDVSKLVTHNTQESSPSYAYMLTQMDYPDFPVPVGVFRNVDRPIYDEMLETQVLEQCKSKGEGDLQTLLNGKNSWVVK